MLRRPSALLALILLPALLLPAAPAKKPARKSGLPAQIGAILAQPSLARAYWGIDVRDLESGKTIYAFNANHFFLPASNAKLFTTAAALAIAGPNYRFLTTVEANGR